MQGLFFLSTLNFNFNFFFPLFPTAPISGVAISVVCQVAFHCICTHVTYVHVHTFVHTACGGGWGDFDGDKPPPQKKRERFRYTQLSGF